MEPIWLSFIICLASAAFGFFLAKKIRRTKRVLTYDLALSVVFGFVSYLLVLIVNAMGIDWYYFDEILIGAGYSYFMEGAKLFRRA